MNARSDAEISAIEKLTQDLDLAFQPATETQSTELFRFLETVAAKLQVPLIAPDLSAERFLSAPLNPDQRKAIDEGLGPIYREEALHLQCGLKDIQIEESGEPLVDLQARFELEGLHAVFSTDPYRPDAEAIPRTFWGRAGFVDRLVSMTQGFNAIGLRPYVHDLFRRPGAQEGLYRGAYALVRREMGLSGQALTDTVRALVAYCPAIAAHKGGAAVDIFLQSNSGEFLDLGNSFSQPGPGVAIKFPFVTWEQYKTRQLYACIAGMADCTVYPFEDWHASYGDAFTALARGETTCKYGPVEGFDPATGAVIPCSPEKLWQAFAAPTETA